jgi:hypothetical protein
MATDKIIVSAVRRLTTDFFPTEGDACSAFFFFVAIYDSPLTVTAMKIKLSALDREIRANPGNSKRINAPFYAPKRRDAGALLLDCFTLPVGEGEGDVVE